MPGTTLLIPGDDILNHLITATEAASLCGVALCTITKWVRENKLTPAGLNEHGRKLYRLVDIAKTEKATRQRAGR